MSSVYLGSFSLFFCLLNTVLHIDADSLTFKSQQYLRMMLLVSKIPTISVSSFSPLGNQYELSHYGWQNLLNMRCVVLFGSLVNSFNVSSGWLIWNVTVGIWVVGSLWDVGVQLHWVNCRQFRATDRDRNPVATPSVHTFSFSHKHGFHPLLSLYDSHSLTTGRGHCPIR